MTLYSEVLSPDATLKVSVWNCHLHDPYFTKSCFLGGGPQQISCSVTLDGHVTMAASKKRNHQDVHSDSCHSDDFFSSARHILRLCADHRLELCSYLKVDMCSVDIGIDPASQLLHWGELRDALNATGHRILYSICPHTTVPETGPSAPWWRNGTGLVYAPPLTWTALQRKGLANSLLVEYVNLLLCCVI